MEAFLLHRYICPQEPLGEIHVTNSQNAPLISINP